MSFTELEKLLIDVFINNPDVATQLKDDPSYLDEDVLVELIAEEISTRKLDKQALLIVDSNNWIQRSEIQEIPNINDITIQSVLCCPDTPQEVLEDLLERNPDWINNGWWCAQRLLQNSSISSDLVAKCAEALIEMEELEVLELAIEHPNVSQETKSRILSLEI